jgi:hypothetical protein
MYHLKELVLEPFTVNDIKAKGWLEKQLHIQKNSLGGNLHNFWEDIKDSKWIGGDCEGWERVPYWLDGLIPLAYLTENEELKQVAKRYIDAIIERQEEDGWICPCDTSDRHRYDMWALILILKVLVEYERATGDPRIEGVVYRALQNFNRHIDSNSIYNWAASRWYEGLIAIYWLYERRPEQWLYHLVVKLRAQGLDYQQLMAEWPYQDKTERGQWSFMNHVVNYAMAVKGLPLYSRISQLAMDLQSGKEMIEKLFQNHGTASGIFTGDECLAGTDPIQGTELCAVVEFMYSLEHMIQLTGETKWADMLEYVTFNALPATFSEDMWTHQYDQMVNQVECSLYDKEHIHFTTNNEDAHLFGLEPNYGCCTANFGQGWPKFALSTFMATKKGIASVLLVPSEVTTEIKGAKVTITLVTEYPFREHLRYHIRVSKPVTFEFRIRIPEFATGATIQGEPVTAGQFHVIEREFTNEEIIDVILPSNTEFVQRPSGMVVIKKGMLLYSIAVDGKWEMIPSTEAKKQFPHCDYEIKPTSPWNYAFASKQVHFEYHGIGEYPFGETNPPISGQVEAVRIPWKLEHKVIASLPESLTPIGEIEKVKIIPFGCSTLRMTEVPML